jgi:hypothetical protein
MDIAIQAARHASTLSGLAPDGAQRHSYRQASKLSVRLTSRLPSGLFQSVSDHLGPRVTRVTDSPERLK